MTLAAQTRVSFGSRLTPEQGEGRDPKSDARARTFTSLQTVTYRIFDTSEIDERRKAVASELGARAIKVNQFDNQPGQAGKEHDEVASGQEEIYIPVRGTGVLRVDDDEVALEPGRFVLVPPEATRQVVGGDDGLTYVVIGAVVS